MEEKRQVWSTADIIKNRNNWTLASDVELLKHIKSLSEKFVQKSQSVSQSLRSFENDVYNTCTSVANINNHFEALSDTQFVENKVRDDGSEVEDVSVKCQLERSEISDNITGKLNEALSHGIQVLRTQYDIIAVTDSDSEEDEPPEVLLKARNPFMSRRLPYIIGSEEFSKHDHLGLVTSSEDEEDEKESDAEDVGEGDDVGGLKDETLKPESVINDINRFRTQVIQVSSDSEDSENEQMEKNTRNNIHSQPTLRSSSYASHVDTTLQNANRNPITPLVDDIFSSPPLPTNDDNHSMSDDERSDNYSDIFAPVRKENIERTKSSMTYDKVDNILPKDVESNTIFEKSSIMNDISRSSSVTSDSEPPHADTEDSSVSAKVFGDKSVVNMFSAINAELNNKFKKKVVGKDNLFDESSPVTESEKSISSTDDLGTIERKTLLSKSSLSSRSEVKDNIPVSKPELASNISQSSDPIPKSLNSGVRDISSKPTSEFSSRPIASIPNKSTSKPKMASLFDDDDSLDELFNSKNTKKTHDPVLSVDNSRKTLFDEANDLFSNDEVEEQTSRESVPKTPYTTTSNPIKKKTDLFGDDSDSGDDIFAIIKSQKKSTPVISNLGNEKRLFMSNNDHEFEEEPSNVPGCVIAPAEKKTEATTNVVENNNASEIKREENNTFGENLMKEIFVDLKSKNKRIGLFDSDDEIDDLFHVSAEVDKKSPASNSVTNRGLDENLFDSQRDNLRKNTAPPNVAKDEKSTVLKIDELLTSNTSTEIARQPKLTPQKESSENLKKEKTTPPDSIDEMLRPKVTKNALDHETSGEYSTEIKINKLSRQFEGPLVPPVSVKDNSSNNQSSSVKVPAKLAANRGLNINVSALLPGSNWSSITKLAKDNNKESDFEESSIPAGCATPVDTKSSEISSNLSATVAKDRLKVSVKRRPPSRRARVNKALQSDLFASNSTIEFDDDGLERTSQSTSNSGLVKKKSMDSPVLKKEETSSLSESKSFPISIKPLTNQEEIVNKFAEQPVTITEVNRTVDDTTDQGKTENKTANDLGNILITASSSREPPALVDDVSSLLNDSDKDDDLFDDLVTENRNISASIPQLDHEVNDDLFGVKTSSLATKIKESTSFSSFGGNHTNESLHDSKSSNISSESQTQQISSPPADSKIAGKLSSSLIPMSDDVSNTIKNEVESKNFETDTFLFSLRKDEESLPKKAEKLSSDLFSFDQDSDDDFDELFSKVRTSTSKKPSQPNRTNQVENDVKDEISVSNTSNLPSENNNKDRIPYSETILKTREILDVRGLSSSRSNAAAKNSSNVLNKSNIDLFAEDDDDGDALFSSNSKQTSSSSRKSAAKNLFEDTDDDDSLFGSKVSSRSKKSVETMKTAKSANSVENMRVVKLRSQIIEEDPLSGEVIKK